jgi:phosphate/sulfate permease
MDLALLITAILLVLALVGLIVGVSNDAVNFINSAVGSKVSTFKVIIGFASAGIIVGVLFSSGMMDIAKTGIFHPQYFTLLDLLFIFLAVMFSIVLLLDLFNSFGLPTSTTVALIAGLFGAALAISTLKLINSPEQYYLIFTEYLNVANIFRIFTGIIFSIIIAFFFGGIVQFLARAIFTFDYKKKLKKFGGIWVGFSMTVLMYFIFLKGIKGLSFATEDLINFIQSNQLIIFAATFLVSGIIAQLIFLFTKINLLKVIVLIGTFSLSLSFASNDLVNFIGTPLAGLASFQIAQGMENPLNTTMNALATTKVQAETWMLLLAGIIMVLTLIFSKKAKTVTKTEVSLASQEESNERFESNVLARTIVRMVLVTFDAISPLIPRKLKVIINRRFDIAKYRPIPDENGNYPSYDLLRASVILVVSSALISLGTSLQLPLSTTYVTFLVSMSAALSDRSWGRESAVYRVSGVITVIAGWFFTAFMAALVAFIIAAIFYYTNWFGVIGFSILTILIFLKSAKMHKKKELAEAAKIKKLNKSINTEAELVLTIKEDISDFIQLSAETFSESCKAFIVGDLKKLKNSGKDAKIIAEKVHPITNELLETLKYTALEKIETQDILSKTITSVVSISDKLSEATKSLKDYVDNNHNLLYDVQSEELSECVIKLNNLISKLIDILNNPNHNITSSTINIDAQILKNHTKQFSKNQLKRIKRKPAGMKRSMLYLNLLKYFDYLTDDFIIIFNTSMEINYNFAKINDENL